MENTKPKRKTVSIIAKKASDMAMTALNPQYIRELKSKLHHLKPIIIIGNKGITDAVIQETDRALNDHELIKVRAHSSSREEFLATAKKLCADTQASLVHMIGHIIAIYRKNLQLED